MAKALFLDRDGVINIDHGYISRIEDFTWRDGIFELVSVARTAGYLPVVVTNQSGIGRGYYTEEEFQALTRWMCAEFFARGAVIERVYHCPFHPEAVDPRYRADHLWRKPRPGMLFAARDDLGIDLANSLMIGDRWSDMEAGAAAGVGRLALIGSEPGAITSALPGVIRLESLRTAVGWLSALAKS
jgi:D-glycero-D-manno-heptose 1,7-bisphosphate phosphatase